MTVTANSTRKTREILIHRWWRWDEREGGEQNGNNGHTLEEVSRHPALFDFTRDEYKSTEARNRHWAEVAEEMQQSGRNWGGAKGIISQMGIISQRINFYPFVVEFVRTRWKTLRDRFKKEVRRQHQCMEGPIWQHYDKMLYLLPFIRDKE